MSKVMIRGPFATGDDVATVHGIPPERREWLDAFVSKLSAGSGAGRHVKSRKVGQVLSGEKKKLATEAADGTRLRRASKVARLPAKKK